MSVEVCTVVLWWCSVCSGVCDEVCYGIVCVVVC